MEAVFFHNIRKEIIQILNEASESIDIAMAWFTNQAIFDVLIHKLKQGVKIRAIILDDEINRNDVFGLDFSKFIKSGGILFLSDKEHKFMHNKFCIVDNKKLITGSYNWTNYAEERNLENIIISDADNSIKGYNDYFEELINELTSSTVFNRIPYSTITRETYSGNYDEFMLEEKLSNNKAAISNDKVIVVEGSNRHNPTARYNIGFRAVHNNNIESLITMIEKGQSLPTTCTHPSWLNLDDIEEISCEIYYGDNHDNIKGNESLADLKLNIPKKKKGELHFKTNMTLDTNGYLHVEFICVETGNYSETSTSDLGLVNYNN